MWKKRCSILLAAALVISPIGTGTTNASAKAVPKLAKKSLSLTKGKTKTVKIKNANGMKVTVKVKKTGIVKIMSKSSKAIKLKGLKAGKTTVQVTLKKGSLKKVLRCKVVVTKKKAATTSIPQVTQTPQVTVSQETTSTAQATNAPSVTPETQTTNAPHTSQEPESTQAPTAVPVTTPDATTVPNDLSLEEYVSPSRIDYTGADNTQTDSYDATVTLDDSNTATVAGDNASNVTVEDGVVTFSADGNYYVTGTLSNGYLKIAKNCNVHLFIENVTIKCIEHAPITIKGSDTSTILTVIGSNLLSEEGAQKSTDSDSACIEAQSPVTINGEGSLELKAYRYAAIKVRSTLKIYNTTVFVESSVDNGIVAKEGLGIYNSTIDVKDTVGDGIKVTKGYLDIQRGKITIACNGDGIEAATTAYLDPDTLDITTTAASDDSTGSCKGIKVAGADDLTEKAQSVLEIAGGTINIDSYDNAIHCGNGDTDYNTGTIKITGGTFTISAGYKDGSYLQGTTSSGDKKEGNKGIHAKDGFYIENAAITVEHSFEGMEADAITVKSGTITITATDDGINGAGGNDQTSYNDAGDSAFILYDGLINVDAAGDGIDINGDFYMYGGEVYVDGPVDNGNGALDYDGICEITGGTLFAIGSSGMAQAPSNSSQQPSMSVNFSSIQKAGSVITVKDADGNVLCTHTAKKQFANAVISDSDFQLGSTYSIYIDDTQVREVIFTSTNMTDGSLGGPGGNTPGGNEPGGNNPGGFRPWHS